MTDPYQQDRRADDRSEEAARDRRLAHLERVAQHLESDVAELKDQAKRHDEGQREILRVLGLIRREAEDDRKELKANTEVTEQVRDMWKAGTWIQKTIVWLGAAAGGVAGFVALWFAFKKDGAL